MKLDKLILVNWGALRTQEYPMGNMTLLTGPTGSGKSTMLDALQTVMTAVYQGVFSYNPGQDETTQSARNGKSKRTLWSYIAGAEDNLFARPNGAHGYIAAVFKPSEGEDAREFTALVAAAARVDGSGERRQAVQERLGLLIIDDTALALDDLIDVHDGQMSSIPVEKIDTHLEQRYRNKVNNYRDLKREYLCQLYGRFRGKKGSVSFPEAEQAARAWSQSIAHKPIGSVDELVKTQILEHDPQQLSQRIAQISGLMRQVSNLHADGERLSENINRVELIVQAANQSTGAYQSALQYQLLSSKRSLREDEHRQRAAEHAIQDLNEKIEWEKSRSQSLEQSKDALQKSQIQLVARLSGIPAAEQKQQIEARLAEATKNAQSAILSLSNSIAAADSLQRTARQIIGSEFPSTMRRLNEAAEKVGSALSPCISLSYATNADVLKQLGASAEIEPKEVFGISRAFEGADSKFGALHSALTNVEDSFASELHAQIGAISASISEAERRERDAAIRKANLAQGGADYPRPIHFALNQIRTDLSGARTQVLCDLIEPISKEWQPAIEGYLGGARFNFVVDQEWEAKAITFVRERGLKANIIQGSLCLKRVKEELVPADSIIHELETEHPVAKAYLIEQFGGVVKVPDAETLRHTSRGLTKDGKGSGGRTMFNADEQNLVFGKEAKRLARERAEKDHKEAEEQLQTLRGQLRRLQELLALVGRVLLPNFNTVEILEQSARDIETAKADLSRLDLKEVKELEAQVEALNVEIRSITQEINASNEKVGGYKHSIEQHKAELTKLQAAREGRLGKVKSDGFKLQNLCMVNSALSFTGLEGEVDALLAANTMSIQEIHAQANQQLVNAQSCLGDLREALADYNSHARNDERFDAYFGAEVRNDDFAPIYAQLITLLEKAREQLVAQRDIGLVKNLDQLRIAKESFKDVFTKQFCYEIRNMVDNGLKTLRSLNSELEKLKFGTDKFRIDWSEWVPEYRDYYEFFSAAYDLSESQESGDLFDAPQLSEENCKVRDRLVSLLLSEDQERALKELQRIADYRNYRRYEIWKESEIGSRVALSEWGTGSGGQLETPAYIVRAAVVTHRLKHFDKGTNLKLVVNDESFAKMDERRAHDVIKFMRDNLGMQLICAMPTKHAGAIKSEFTKEWCFTRTEAHSNGEVDFVSEADERDLNPDRLRELWAARREQVRMQAQIAFEAEERKLA